VALKTFQIPLCDACGKPWFPSEDLVHKGIKARQDPRGYDAARKADGLKGLRCGKCKTPYWDVKFLGDGRKKPRAEANGSAEPAPEPPPAVAEIPSPPVSVETPLPARVPRCKHGRFRCQECER
jgi:hypothetical protein